MNKVEKSFFGIDDNWTKKLKGKYGQDMTNKTFFKMKQLHLGYTAYHKPTSMLLLKPSMCHMANELETADLKPFEIQSYSTTRKQNIKNDCIKFVN